MSIILLKIISKIFSAIDAIFPNAKNLNPVEITILSTVILSAIIAIFHTIKSLINKGTFGNSFNLFMYSFLGGLLGGFTGTIISFVSGCLIYLIIPSQIYIGPEIMFHALWLMTLMFLCWLAGVLIGGITTIRPLIKFFSNQRI